MVEDYSYNHESKAQIKKDYWKKSFSNPYFDKLKGGFNTKLYLQILILVFLVYFFVYSDTFKIKKIEIQGSDLISKEELTSTINNYLGRWTFFLIPKNNLIYLGKGSIKNEIQKNFSLESIELDRGWQTLKVTLKEKISYLIINNHKNFYYAGLDGTIIKQITELEASKRSQLLPVVNIDKDLNIGDQVFSDKKVNFILELDKEIKEQKLKAKNYEDRGVMEVSAVFTEDWKAIFSLESDIPNSVENLKLILERKIADRKNLEYIDLRMGDKVYYK